MQPKQLHLFLKITDLKDKDKFIDYMKNKCALNSEQIAEEKEDALLFLIKPDYIMTSNDALKYVSELDKIFTEFAYLYPRIEVVGEGNEKR